MDERQSTGPEGSPEGPPSPPAKEPSRLSTPVLVGTMAAGILAVAFLVAIVRGGGGDGRATAPPPPAAGEPGEAGEAASTGTERGATSASAIRLVSPRGTVARQGLSFRWEPAAGMTEYQVTVFDALMKKFWSSPRVASDHIEPPARILAQLAGGPTYRWMVSGFPAQGDQVDSGSLTFRLAE